MPTPQSLDEFILEAKKQYQRKIRIAIVGDPSLRPWKIRVEAYNQLYFDVESENANIFNELHAKLTTAGFQATIITRQPHEGKLDPALVEVFSKFPASGIDKKRRRRGG